MYVAEAGSARAASRPPRAMAWVLLLASAAAVLVIGVASTVLIVGSLTSDVPVPGLFWPAFAGACAATIVSVGIRSLRWVFLLRRASIRIPIRDAYIGYFSGLSLLFAPFLIGEIAIRAHVLRARGRVPFGTVVVVNLWERLLDLTALAAIAGVIGLLIASDVRVIVVSLVLALLSAMTPVRRIVLDTIASVVRRFAPAQESRPAADYARLAVARTWWVSLVTSIAAWLLPGLALWTMVLVWWRPYGAAQGLYDYAAASGTAGVMLAPGGILVAGAQLLAALESRGVGPGEAALIVVGIRLATVGVATVLGAVVLALHQRSAAFDSRTHFDDIADAYDVQIPEARRDALLERKTAMMRDVIERVGRGRRGLDVGCGQGWHLGTMRELGFEVFGIDASAGQADMAAARLGLAGVVRHGSVLEIPAPDASYDFAYIINVLHHLDSIADQRRAFSELFRVLRPGGLLMVHEINTRNILFRFYMGYVFPSLNCIDEGIERWLRPDRLSTYTDAPIVDERYFTFLPDFLPGTVVRAFGPIERRLERSPLRVYSAHYMAVLRKP
jgi:ubiquinone/menaquinone biosynthesis C-methylase UbiE